ncbi:hypothetical protein ARMGADRAFT_1074963 [Armillaria gallica]|uniref:Uncharacterized protein n=1 Tax=Armillaria gallica TaxID=47427 RepID=A0A2H3EF84_ARMGA|nr:hypothetical protein ARMGADRAFT_1074963 [Armillaria gallica]
MAVDSPATAVSSSDVPRLRDLLCLDENKEVTFLDDLHHLNEGHERKTHPIPLDTPLLETPDGMRVDLPLPTPHTAPSIISSGKKKKEPDTGPPTHLKLPSPAMWTPHLISLACSLYHPTPVIIQLSDFIPVPSFSSQLFFSHSPSPPPNINLFPK